MRRTLFALALGTTVVLGSSTLVLLPPAQRLLVALSPDATIPPAERLAAAERLARYFATGNQHGLAGYREDERAHLREVAVVARTLAGILAAAAALALATGWRIARRESASALRQLSCRTFRATAVGSMAVLLSGLLLFAPLFAVLHPFIFIAPWAFDPTGSRMINEFPPEYFRAAFVLALLTASVVGAALAHVLAGLEKISAGKKAPLAGKPPGVNG